MVIRYEPEQWKEYSEAAHLAVFAKIKPSTWDRISYALVVVDDERKRPLGYITVRENDHESVYWQFGGAFPAVQCSTWVVRGYSEFLAYQKTVSRRVQTYIENTNYPMLKMAMKFGFLVVGTRTYGEKVYCDLLKEF